MRQRFFMASYDRPTTEAERALYVSVGEDPPPLAVTEVIYNTTRDDVTNRARELMRLYGIEEAWLEAVTGEVSESGTIIASTISADTDEPFGEVIEFAVPE